MTEWMVGAADEHGVMSLGTVEADTEDVAIEAAQGRFFLREGETLKVRPRRPGERVLITMSRLKDSRQDHLTHKIPVGAIVEVPEFKLYFGESFVDGWEEAFVKEHGEEAKWNPEYNRVRAAAVIEGSQIEIVCRARFHVVSQDRDCDGTPLYTLSSQPIVCPTEIKARLRYQAIVDFLEHGYSEESLVDTGLREELQPPWWDALGGSP